jgi:hypothetical protein
VIVFSQRLRSRTSVCFCFRFYFSAPIDRPPLGVDAQAKASLMAVIGWSGEPVRQLGIEFAKGLDKLRADAGDVAAFQGSADFSPFAYRGRARSAPCQVPEPLY